MEGKICLIKQPAGLGDILLCQKIASSYVDKGFRVLWPVISNYIFLKDYIVTRGVEFLDEKEDFLGKEIYLSNTLKILQKNNFLFIPLCTADQFSYHNSMLVSKFIFSNVENYKDWADYFTLRRNLKREKYLENILRLPEKFNLINKRYGTPPQYEKYNNNIIVNNGNKNIEMNILGFDNPFDWCGVFEKAQEIHTVDTSLSLILTKLKLNNVNLYERINSGPHTYKLPTNNYLHKDFFPESWKIFVSATTNGFW